MLPSSHKRVLPDSLAAPAGLPHPSSALPPAALSPRDGFERAVKRLCFSPSPSVTEGPEGPAAEDTEDFIEQLLGSHLGATAATSAACDADPPSSEARSLDEVGPDLLLHILRLAKPTAWDLCRMACVSKTWQELSSSRVFWTKLRVSSGSIRPGVEALASRCQHVQELHIDDPRCELFILHPIVLACAGTLTRVVINCDRDTSSRNEAAICSILWIISLHCKRVETVELVSSGAHAGFEYIDNKALWYLTSGFRGMRSFACLCQDAITKQSLYLMVIAWRELTCLRVHCGQLLRDDLLCLKKCSQLRVLELAGGDLGRLMEGGRTPEGSAADASRQLAAHPAGVIHSDLEVLVLTNTATCPTHLAALLASFPGLKRVLLNKQSWAQGTPQDMPRVRRQFGSLQRWLQAQRGVELLMEE